MRLDELEQVLRETLEDRRLSRGERRALGEVLGDAAPPGPAGAEARAWLRSRAFELARELQPWDGPAREVLGWLEGVVKALAAGDRAPDGARGGAGPAAHSRVLFSPRDDCPGEISRVLGRTRRAADICVFTITDDRIADAVLQAGRRGVRVRVITDDVKSGDRGSDIERLERAGVPVRRDRSPAHMHNKFAVLDGRTVLTGSYNWTRSAARENQENLVVTDDPVLAGAYSHEFARLWTAFQ